MSTEGTSVEITIEYDKILKMALADAPQVSQEELDRFRQSCSDDSSLREMRERLDSALTDLDERRPSVVDPIEDQHRYLGEIALVTGMKEMLDQLIEPTS